MKPLLSPRELAAAIGVSESSVKRWVDGGLIAAARTAGGHRRIAVEDAVRFIRESGSAVVRPDLIGLGELAAAPPGGGSRQEEAEGLYVLLRDGLVTEARGFVVSLYLAGRSVAQIVDGRLRSAMVRLGELWNWEEEEGIFEEHRATAIAIEAMSRLRSLFRPASGAPVAIGGAPFRDPHILPSLCATAVLESVGLRAVNLGPDTPLDSLARGAERVGARLVWLSVSVAADPGALSAAVLRLLARLDAAGRSTLMVGGREITHLQLTHHPRLYTGDSMAELEAFGKGLRSAAGDS